MRSEIDPREYSAASLAVPTITQFENVGSTPDLFEKRKGRNKMVTQFEQPLSSTPDLFEKASFNAGRSIASRSLTQSLPRSMPRNSLPQNSLTRVSTGTSIN